MPFGCEKSHIFSVFQLVASGPATTTGTMSESDSGGVGSGGGQQHTYRDDVMDMETFVTKLIHRLCQYIVQSRQGELTKAKSDPNATRQVWFSVSVKVCIRI